MVDHDHSLVSLVRLAVDRRVGQRTRGCAGPWLMVPRAAGEGRMGDRPWAGASLACPALVPSTCNPS